MSNAKGARTFYQGQYLMGRIDRVEPSLQAVFVNFGQSRHGFLPIAAIDNFDESKHKKGRYLIVRIKQIATDDKGALLTAPDVHQDDIELDSFIAVVPQKSPIILSAALWLVAVAIIVLVLTLFA